MILPYYKFYFIAEKHRFITLIEYFQAKLIQKNMKLKEIVENLYRSSESADLRALSSLSQAEFFFQQAMKAGIYLS